MAGRAGIKEWGGGWGELGRLWEERHWGGWVVGVLKGGRKGVGLGHVGVGLVVGWGVGFGRVWVGCGAGGGDLGTLCQLGGGWP